MQDWLAAQAMARPEGTALIVGAEVLTYRALNERVADVAARLAAIGVGRGTVLGVLLPNRLEAVLAIHAAVRLGATLALLNTRLTPHELVAQLRQAACDLLICDGETARGALEMGAVPRLVCVDPVDDPRLDRLDQLPGGAADYREGWIDLEDPFVIIFTSGTSGRPKGAVLTYGAIFASAMGSAYRIGVLPHDRWLCVLPLYHIGGVSILMRACLYGTAVDLWRQFDAGAIADYLADEPITLISLVPTMVYRLLERHNPQRPPQALRLALLGGAVAPPDLVERALRLGWPIATTYGLTEAASQVATALPDEVQHKPGSVGRPLLFTQVRVVDAQGHNQPPGVYGEIVVSGPTLMRGYLAQGPGARSQEPGEQETRDRRQETREQETRDKRQETRDKRQETGEQENRRFEDAALDERVCHVQTQGAVIQNPKSKIQNSLPWRDGREGWFATGDIGYLDIDGDLWVVQRRSDLIISGGENIYPSEIEQVLRAHPDVADVAVLGVDSAEWGQQVGAVIVLRDPEASIEQILADSRTRLAGYKQPRVTRVVAELPQTASGKLDRLALMEMLRSDRVTRWQDDTPVLPFDTLRNRDVGGMTV